MAPDTRTYSEYDLRPTNITGAYSTGYYIDDESNIFEETDDQKKKRIAMEKMHSSWKVYNQKTQTIIRIKQVCKPRHRINHIR